MGDGECAGAIGQSYEEQKDYDKAIEWYKKGFALGSKDSVTRLGYLYKNVLKDKKQGIYWYTQGYEKLGCEDCALSIGLTYEDDLHDIEKAIEWYNKGYALGDSRCANNLGYLYATRLKDKEKAIEWYKKAIQLGSTKAINNLKDLGVESEQ